MGPDQAFFAMEKDPEKDQEKDPGFFVFMQDGPPPDQEKNTQKKEQLEPKGTLKAALASSRHRSSPYDLGADLDKAPKTALQARIQARVERTRKVNELVHMAKRVGSLQARQEYNQTRHGVSEYYKEDTKQLVVLEVAVDHAMDAILEEWGQDVAARATGIDC